MLKYPSSRSRAATKIENIVAARGEFWSLSESVSQSRSMFGFNQELDFDKADTDPDDSSDN
jgi:hypothetical protein